MALKEWAVICQALHEGRQIVLLRKGGLEDEEGVFRLEHSRFWLLPTYEHQAAALVKSEHRDLFGTVREAHEPGENEEFVLLRWLAVAERVYALRREHEEQLRRLPHIWTDDYLELRFNYKPQHPLLCVALRVYARAEPYRLPVRAGYFGCRSWIDLETPLAGTELQPVLEDAAFQLQADEVARVLGG